MKTFSIRIEEELFDKVEAARGEKARTDFLREVILGYFVTKSSPELNQASPDQVKHMESLQSDITFLRDQINELNRRLEKEQSLVSQEQVITLQTQRLLPAPGQTDQEQTEINKKSWWQFWSK